MPSNVYLIRSMKRDELDLALGWAAAEGWNPGLHDADSFYAADPDGFLIGMLDGVPIASIFAVKYGESFAFIGGYIVKPEWRGKGYGMAIWNAAMASLGQRNIGLDGVVAQQANYRKSGFMFANRNIRYQTTGTGGRTHAPGTVALSTLPFEQIKAYDQAFFPAPRDEFLKQWIVQPEGAALGMMRGEDLIGYGVLRRCIDGYKIGPLFADTPEVAEALLLSLASEAKAGAPVFLDVSQHNPDALALAASHSMSVSFETARMYTGPEPDLSMPRMYGVTSFELG
jgi:GNAT superfamily N-acetyltransferase